jgi:ribosomal protein S18 acetylase RimI-like enzyme
MSGQSDVSIEPFHDAHLDELVALALRAWAPVFDSLAEVLGPELFREQYPDWQASQRDAVIAGCRNDEMQVRVAILAGRVAGFSALKLHKADRMGEVHMIAVDPSHQRRGIARALIAHSEHCFATAGMSSVMLETGGDRGHAPARRTYEAAGFTAFPCVRYFKNLGTREGASHANCRSVA